MGRRVGFHFYSLKIRQKQTSEREVLSSLRGRQDALTLLHDGMQQLVNSHSNDQAAKRLACLLKVDRTGRQLTGVLEAGGYGETANIVHAPTRKTVHRQKSEEAAMLPCFFRIVIPKNVDRAVVILQRDNRVPAKQALGTILRRIIHGFDEHLTCDLTPIANKATFDKMVRDGEVQELRFIRSSIPEDIATGYGQGRKEVNGSAEVRFWANRGAILPMKDLVRSWLRPGSDALDNYEIPGMEKFAFTRVKVALRIGKKKQQVDFGRRVTQPIVDMTDQVRLDPVSGHPTYESLLEVTAELAENDSYTAHGDEQ